MLKGKIDRSELDAIGKTLVRQAFDRRPDVEKILADPYLFARIKARINAGNESSDVVSSPLITIFSLRKVMGSGLAAVLIAVIVGLSFLSSKETALTNDIQTLPQRADVARPLDPPQVIVDKFSQSRATNFDMPRAEKIAVRGGRKRSPQPNRNVEFDSDGEFYPVTYSGDIEEAATSGRVIRVDLDRSSLFALGVNLPLENDVEIVKADLLVGRDGVTRAIRLVK